jgi:hypothetical protein
MSMQAGLAELVDGVEHAYDGDLEEESGTLVEKVPVSTPPFLYVIPTAPHVTSVCALCGTNSTVGRHMRTPILLSTLTLRGALGSAGVQAHC